MPDDNVDPDGAKPMHVVTRAKVNLHLGVIRRLRDGYHEIETILQSVDLCDEMDVTLTRDGAVSITCDRPDIPTDDRNLCAKTIVAMRPYAGDDLGAQIKLSKRIPSGAGLGGGSGNAAGILHAVNRGAGLSLGTEELEKIAATIGSDVPFMIRGGTMVARGRGELLTPVGAPGGGFFLIVKPPINISTAWVYANYNFQLTKHKPRLNLKTVSAVLGRIPGTALAFRNDLEDVVCPSHPSVASVLDAMLSEKPCFASMSGSGSALFAIFESYERAALLAERFSVQGFFTSVVEPAKRAVDIN